MQEQLPRSGSFAYKDVGEGREQERKLCHIALGLGKFETISHALPIAVVVLSCSHFTKKPRRSGRGCKVCS